MLPWLATILAEHYRIFSVFQYLTLRSILATLTAFLIALWLGPRMIQRLTQYRIGQSIRDDGPQNHLKKTGTPTMGGVLMLAAISVSTLLWCNLNNRFVWIALFTLLSFGAIGYIDDYRKLIYQNSKGLSARWKYFWQSVLGLGVGAALYFTAKSPIELQLYIPFFKNAAIFLGFGYILWTYFVIVASSNAVNLTDGLDGLAIFPTVIVAGALGLFAYLAGHIEFAHYLAIPYIPQTGEIAIFCAAMFGAGLGFLWFNTYPAQVFMGDVGALGLGAALGVVAIMIKQEFVFALMAGIFVIETVSVILQVLSFKLTGKRIFKMAPLHHHFELKGWPEPRVIVRFWIISIVLVLFGLATLKLR